jgi:nitroimidazol reductase NimA-like FMN-containing flavoprotein (pyridoxamine 5'-phosphate oxidase superfamily)
MSVRMTDDETWELLERSTKGILTTLRRDGRPVALPVWYVVLDRKLFVSTRGKKVERARHDARCSFLVEGGDRWVELRAVHLDCTASLLDRGDERRPVIAEQFAVKYATLRTARSGMPEDTRQHYEEAVGAILELTPNDKALTWDNRKLGVQ